MIVPLFAFFPHETSAQDGSHFQHTEEIGCGVHRFEPRCLASPGERHGAPHISRQAAEDMVLFAPVEEIWRRSAEVTDPVERVCFLYRDHAIRFRKG